MFDKMQASCERDTARRSAVLHRVLYNILPFLIFMMLTWPATSRAAEKPEQAGTAISVAAQPISLGAGESIVLSANDANRVAVAEPKVADVAVVSRSEVLLTGRAPGETTLHIWSKDGLRTLAVRVFENTASLVNEIKSRIALPEVDAWIRQGTVVLEGAVSSLGDKQRAVQVAGAYGKVIDLLSIQGAEATTGASVSATNATVVIDPAVQDAKLRGKLTELGALIGDSNLRLSMINDTLVLDGSLADTYAQERARRLASLYFPQVLDVSAIRGPGVQVALKVHVLEVDRTGVGELGVAWGSMNRGVLDTNAFYIGELAMDWQLKRLMLLGAKINTLVDDGHAKILAAPTLLTLSGGTASFLAGGEIPITMPQGDNKYSVEWKEYGIRLQVKPLVDASGYVTVSLTPEVSTLDWANAVRISTIALPALRTRRTETQVRVADGATLVLGGLISREESKQATKMPFISELPVIGRLFRSDKFTNGETELLFLVTPHVLREGESLTPEAVVLPGGLEPDGKESSVSRPKILEMVP